MNRKLRALQNLRFN